MKKRKLVIGISIGILFIAILYGAINLNRVLTDYLEARVNEEDPSQSSLGGVVDGINEDDTEIAKADDEAISFSSSMSRLDDDAIEYEDEAHLNIEYKKDETMVLWDYLPKSGTFGTIIKIEGQNIGSKDIVSVLLDDFEVPIYNLNLDYVMIAVPSTLPVNMDYILSINYEDTSLEVGSFYLQGIETTLLMEEEIMDISQQHYFESEYVNVFVPQGALKQPDILTVERIDSPLAVSFDGVGIEGDRYLVEIGDQHEFNDMISLAIPLPEGYLESGKDPRVTYFDDENGTWEPMFSEVTEQGMLAIRTYHLTPIDVIWSDSSIVSHDGNFKIYYDSDDTKLGSPSMTTPLHVASGIASALEEAKEAYDKALGSEYALKSPLLGPHIVVVDSDYASAGSKYSPSSGIMYCAGVYPTDLLLNTGSAHELFHSYQDEYLTSRYMNMNLWLTEAMAEYASYRIAFNEAPTIWENTKGSDGFGITNETIEYTMGAFLDHMLTKQDKNFKDLYKSYMTQYSYGGRALVEAFFEESDDKALSTYYLEFWMDAFGVNRPQRFDRFMNSLDDSEDILQKPVNFSISGSPISAYNQLINGFIFHRRVENVPKRFIRIEPGAGMRVAYLLINNDVGFAKVVEPNFIGYDEAFINQQAAGPQKWQVIHYLDEADPDHETVEVNAYDILLLSLQRNSDFKVDLREVQAKVVTKSFDNLEYGDKIEVVYGFSQIFPRVKDIMVETDFGDGKILTDVYSNSGTVNIAAEHEYYTYSNQITGTLYDITGGRKEIIGQVVIPVNLPKVEEEELADTEEVDETDENLDDSTDEYDQETDEVKEGYIETEYYSNGNIKSITEYDENGVKLYYEYHFTLGGISETHPYKDGKLDGIVRKYQNNNTAGEIRLYHEIPYKMGVIHGTEILYHYETSTIHIVKEYENGVNVGTDTTYYENGNVQSTIELKDGERNGNSIEYYENGNVKYVIPYVDNLKHGTAKFYRIDGSISHETTYANGEVVSD